MSVLFKALAKAAEANKARKGAPASSRLRTAQPSSMPDIHSPSPMWRALAAAAAAPGLNPVLPSDFEVELPPLASKPRFDMSGLKRLGALGGRIRLSDGDKPSGFRPMRAVLLALVTLLGGTLGALYYFGDDVPAMIEELMGEEPIRRPPPTRRPRPVVQAPKPAEAEPPQEAVREAPVEPEKPKEEPVIAEPAPVLQQTAPEPLPARPPLPVANPADAALDKVLSDAQHKDVREKDIADKAANDLPSVLADVRQRKAQAAITPQIDVRRANGTPSVQVTSPDSKIDMVRVRSSSSQSREDAEQAYSRLLSGQYEGAALLYEQVLKREPKNLSALIGSGTALHKLGRLVDARIMYERALSISPGNREVLSNLLSIYGTQDPSEALRQLEALQRDNPGFSPISAQMASIFAQAGDLAQAIRYQGQAVQLSPENMLYRFNLAVMQDRAGMAPEAAQSYENVLAMASRSNGVSLPMPVAQVRERLDYLRTR